jgi:hypothetical protein
MLTAIMVIHAYGFWTSPVGHTEHRLFHSVKECEEAKPRVLNWMLDRGLDRVRMDCHSIKEPTS